MANQDDFDFFDDPAAIDVSNIGNKSPTLYVQKGAATFLEDNLRQTSVFSSDSEDVHGGDDKVSDHILYAQSSQKTSSASSVATQDDLHGTDYTGGSDEKGGDEKHGGGYHSDSSQSLSYSSDGEKDENKPTKASIKKQAAVKQDTKDDYYSSSDAASSVTDVSPLSSPGAQRKSKQQKSPRSDDEEDEDKHITKLNVTFTSKDGEIQKLSPRQQAGHSKAEEWLETKCDEKAAGGSSASGSSSVASEESEFEPVNISDHEARIASVNMKRQEFIDATGMENMDLNKLLETILDFERKEKQHIEKVEAQQANILPKRRTRKNMSFTNDQVRDIDRENLRLLREITKPGKTSRASRPSSANSMRSTRSQQSARSHHVRTNTPNTQRRPHSSYQPQPRPKLYHSALNRINEQKRIEQENLKLLKRLQSAKPTPKMKRSAQLADYKRQTGYIGASPSYVEPMSRAYELLSDGSVVKRAVSADTNRFRPQTTRPKWESAW